MLVTFTKYDSTEIVTINPLEVFSIEEVNGVTVIHGKEDIHRVSCSLENAQNLIDDAIMKIVGESLRRFEDTPAFKQFIQTIYREYHIQNIDSDDRRKYVAKKYMEKLKTGGIETQVVEDIMEKGNVKDVGDVGGVYDIYQDQIIYKGDVVIFDDDKNVYRYQDGKVVIGGIDKVEDKTDYYQQFRVVEWDPYEHIQKDNKIREEFLRRYKELMRPNITPKIIPKNALSYDKAREEYIKMKEEFLYYNFGGRKKRK